MSSKTSTQQGRRTPLSLGGAVTKSHPNKGVNNAANGSGNNPNGSTTSNNNKQENKLQTQKNDQLIANNSDIKENPNKKLSQTDKKLQQADNKKTNEKNQNGVNSSKQHLSNENKQQHQLKEKPQQQNGSDSNKVNEKDKKEKAEKSDKMDKSEKDDIKSKEDKKMDQDNHENKREEKITKEEKEKDSKEDKKQEQHQPIKEEDIKSKEETQIKSADNKPDEIVENMDVVQERHTQKKSTPVPVTPKSSSKSNKSSGSVNKTPIKVNEKTPQKSTSSSKLKATHVTKREETTTIDDEIEMEPLAIESSPIKSSQPEKVVNIKISPSATSTPGKIHLYQRNYGDPKSDMQFAIDTELSPERPKAFSQISGRKSIRQISGYTPSKFQNNLQFRESYTRINTELDTTNTSMDVTVGSEAPTNFSFSFFGRGRKRERTPPKHTQSAIGELQTDVLVTPPKRARLDMYGFFSVVSSPISLLRNRFSKASLQSSTPVKLQQKLNTAEDEIEVQNVSGVSVHEEIAETDKECAETIVSVNDGNDTTIGEEIKENNLKADFVKPIKYDSEGKELQDDLYGQTCGQSDIKIIATSLQPAVGDPMAKNKRCIVM